MSTRPGFSQSQQRRIGELVLGQRGGLRKIEAALASDDRSPGRCCACGWRSSSATRAATSTPTRCALRRDGDSAHARLQRRLGRDATRARCTCCARRPRPGSADGPLRLRAGDRLTARPSRRADALAAQSGALHGLQRRTCDLRRRARADAQPPDGALLASTSGWPAPDQQPAPPPGRASAGGRRSAPARGASGQRAASAGASTAAARARAPRASGTCGPAPAPSAGSAAPG